MSAKQEDANLILKLYELRREPVLRQARTWYVAEFHPTSAEGIMTVLQGEHSAHYRMVTTYWDMAATLVLHGAIDAAMFHESNGEHVLVYAKIEPYLAELRKLYGNPHLLTNLEKLVQSMPNAEARLGAMRERLKAQAARALAQRGRA